MMPIRAAAGAGQHHNLSCPFEVLLLAHDVDDHEEEQDAAEDLGEAADGGDTRTGVGAAQGKGKQSQQEEHRDR